MSFIPPESPEVANAIHEANDAFDARGRKYEENPELAEQERKELAASLGYKPFVEPKNRHEKPVEEETQVASLEQDTDISENSTTPSNPSEKAESDNPRPKSEAPKEGEKNPETENTQLEKFKENPNYPILERFQEISGGKLTKQDIASLQEILTPEKPLDKESIKKVSFENPETQKYLENYITRVGELNKEPKKVETKGGQETYVLPEEFKGNPLLNKVEDPTIQLLLANYTRLPDRDGNPNFEKDIHTTFEVTANKVIEGKKFPRGEAFDIAMKDIGSKDIETQLQALSYIHSLVNTQEGIKGLKGTEKMALLGKHNLAKEKYMDFRIRKLEIKIKNEEQGKNDVKTINILRKELIKTQEEVGKGDVFEAGKKDMGSEKKETPTEVV